MRTKIMFEPYINTADILNAGYYHFPKLNNSPPQIEGRQTLSAILFVSCKVYFSSSSWTSIQSVVIVK